MQIDKNKKAEGIGKPVSDAPSDIVDWLIGLRNAAERARTTLMLALLHVEEVVFPTRSDWGHESFDSWLKSHEIVRPDVYREFLAGFESMGRDAQLALTLGSNVVPLISRVPQPRRSEYIANTLAIIKDKGAEPSSGAARDEARKCGMEIVSLASKRVTELESLRAENSRLRAENLKLKSELAKARRAGSKTAAAS